MTSEETVFEPLAESFEVVAPDLPGFEDGVPGGPHSVDDYADWLVALLDVLGLVPIFLSLTEKMDGRARRGPRETRGRDEEGRR